MSHSAQAPRLGECESEMVQRVAIAIHRGTLYPPWGEMSPEAQADFVGHARRAIEAMREPTPEMVSRGDWIIDDNSMEIPAHAWNMFQAMIDAALSSSKREARSGSPSPTPKE